MLSPALTPVRIFDPGFTLKPDNSNLAVSSPLPRWAIQARAEGKNLAVTPKNCHEEGITSGCASKKSAQL